MRNSLLMELREGFRAMRLAGDESQAALARRLGVGVKQIQTIEQGSCPNVDRVVALAQRAWGISSRPELEARGRELRIPAHSIKDPVRVAFKSYRESQNQTWEDIVKAAGCSTQTLWRIENDHAVAERAMERIIWEAWKIPSFDELVKRAGIKAHAGHDLPEREPHTLPPAPVTPTQEDAAGDIFLALKNKMVPSRRLAAAHRILETIVGGDGNYTAEALRSLSPEQLEKMVSTLGFDSRAELHEHVWCAMERAWEGTNGRTTGQQRR